MTAEQWQSLVDHAREDAPDECCGYVRLSDGVVDQVVRSDNPRRSPYGFELDSKSLLATNELDDQGYGVGIYHSHPKSPAEPSQTDVNLAFYPHWIHLIVSLAEPVAVVRAWRIVGGKVTEEELLLEP